VRFWVAFLIGNTRNDCKLHYGDTLLLFTDGVVEACDHQNELFGERKLMQTAQEFAHQKASELHSTLLQAASDHCGGKFQDDATLIVLQSKTSQFCCCCVVPEAGLLGGGSLILAAIASSLKIPRLSGFGWSGRIAARERHLLYLIFQKFGHLHWVIAGIRHQV
jgi:hypothetical protein